MTDKKIVLRRLMKPNHANLAGNVHGGKILQMIEEAGAIVATEHCNDVEGRELPDYTAAVTALARVERTDFLQPMFIGEVAQLSADLLYTSAHSVEVLVIVWAENLITGQKRLTNKARLWYVPVSLEKPFPIRNVPPMKYKDSEQEMEGKQAYEQQKQERKEELENERNTKRTIRMIDDDVDQHTPAYSRSQLIHWVDLSDCTVIGHCRGGVILKLMDEVAGMVAAKHCQTNIVTASFDATNFHRKVDKGGLVTVTGEATFSSNKTLEVEVIVDVSEPWIPGSRKRAADAFITYMSLDSNHRPLPVPQLKIHGDEELERFNAGQKRYEKSKALREKAKQSS